MYINRSSIHQQEDALACIIPKMICSRYTAPFGRPEDPEVYRRFMIGSMLAPFCPGTAICADALSLLASSSSSVVTAHAGGTLACSRLKASDALASAASLQQNKNNFSHLDLVLSHCMQVLYAN